MAARNAARPAPNYLAGLNPEQADAVETIDGPLLVLAGAGTGKTRVLTTRIAHIFSISASPGPADPRRHLHQQGRARDEGAHRRARRRHVEGMPWLGTFHSIGVKILRRHAELAGLRSDFTILDTDDQIRLLKAAHPGRGH
jgi:DNA helicase-2/ATP-dependent DNA helicase PcrA